MKNSILSAGIPIEKGTPNHIETKSGGDAFTLFDVKSGMATEMHTPPETLPRIHELMHARHTDPKRYAKQYRNVRDIVAQITEDCRLHINHWPWAVPSTPKIVRDDVNKFLRDEVKQAEEAFLTNPALKGAFPDFGTRLRQAAIIGGITDGPFPALYTVGFADIAQVRLARACFELLSPHGRGRKTYEGKCAELIERAFFPPPPPIQGNPGEGDQGHGRKVGASNSLGNAPPMEIIELPHTVPVTEAIVGRKRGNVGARIYRPAFRKPVLTRPFIRDIPQEPGGTILIDASGSMGSFDVVRQWVEDAPFGTVAYYSGGSTSGELVIYARNGRKSTEVRTPKGGNTVDGPALDWLMAQPGPRIMVTDRHFCGAPDSLAQVVRLAELERQGLVTVMDYSHRKEE